MKRSLVLALLGLLATTWLAAPADARWASSSPGSARALSTTVGAPGTVSATCGLLLDATVKVDWAASTSPWVTQYEVLWGTNSASPSRVDLVTGRTFTTPALSTGTWYFTVRSVKGAWRSPVSNQVSKSVSSVLFLGVVCS
ncbi:MAG: hypothetical protein Q8K58_00955 [Acidimicrobiales bacterium]|nr:hypothetical protein [Acidimicrobiales bacterium]